MLKCSNKCNYYVQGPISSPNSRTDYLGSIISIRRQTVFFLPDQERSNPERLALKSCALNSAGYIGVLFSFSFN